jgi:UDP-N-acetyl-D-glucosamine dehydrogenase
MTREHPEYAGRRSVTLDGDTVAGYDALLIATDHDAVDYRLLQAHAKVIIDTRNACAKAGVVGTNVARA